MGVVGSRIEPLRRGLRNVGLVRGHGSLVGRERGLIVAEAEVDVEGHVHQMSGARHGGRQAIGKGQRPLGLVRCLHHVDVEVDGAGMVRVLRQHFLERGDDLAGLALGLGAAGLPIVPRGQIH